MEEDLHKLWRCLRPTVKDGCTFAMIKGLVATSGLPVEKLSHLQQRPLPEKGASKGELLDAVGDLIEKANEPTEAIRKLIAALLEMNPDLGDKVLECAQWFGWTVPDGQLRPSEFQVEEASDDFGEEVRQSLRTAYERYGQNDYPGAMTAVCSALDTLTLRIYKERDLGYAHEASYQKRACRSFQAFEEAYRTRLVEAQIDEQEVTRIWKNYKGAINQAAYVLGSFRRDVSDRSAGTQKGIRNPDAACLLSGGVSLRCGSAPSRAGQGCLSSRSYPRLWNGSSPMWRPQRSQGRRSKLRCGVADWTWSPPAHPAARRQII